MDVREAIMARLVELMGTIVAVDSVSRNRLVDDDGSERRITVMESEELGSDTDPITRPPTAPRVVHMQPQLILSAAAKSADVGSDLSTLRASVIKAIATDATLIGLTLNNRGGRYIGMESDLAFGKTMLGQMALKFEFTYVLRPDHL